MGHLQEPDLEDPGNIVPEHVRHEDVGVVPVTGTETCGNVANDVQVTFEQFQPPIERVDLEIPSLLPRRLPKQNLVNQLKMRRLHDLRDLCQIELHLFGFNRVLGLN